jgi:hypothetical protein
MVTQLRYTYILYGYSAVLVAVFLLLPPSELPAVPNIFPTFTPNFLQILCYMFKFCSISTINSNNYSIIFPIIKPFNKNCFLHFISLNIFFVCMCLISSYLLHRGYIPLSKPLLVPFSFQTLLCNHASPFVLFLSRQAVFSFNQLRAVKRVCQVGHWPRRFM